MKIKIIVFLFFLIATNFFMFQEGLWFYQDQSSWPKNFAEAYSLLNSQFYLFSNTNYYLGLDRGIFAFNNFLINLFTFSIFNIFGAGGSQLFNSLTTYILVFFSFYFLTSIFFKDKTLRFVLSLIYSFNPLMYSFRGVGLIHAAVPLFIYSFYKFYFEDKGWGKYLLVNLAASSLWLANVRFLHLNFFIIVPYLLFIIFSLRKQTLKIKKIVCFVIFNIIIFLPVLYSFITPFFEKNPGIFNFSSVFNNFVVKGRFYDMFNYFQSTNLILYEHRSYTVLGFCIFITFLIYLLKNVLKEKSLFTFLNIVLMILGFTFFEMGYIFGREAYSSLIKLFPFLTNAPIYGLYLANIPIIFLLGTVGTRNKKVFLSLSSLIVILSVLPLLNFSDFRLQKYQVDKIPLSYQSYFVKSFYKIPEAVQYYPGACWRAGYMQDEKISTLCLDNGVSKYRSISFDNPRVISGKELYITKNLFMNPNIDNLQVTHNLKNIIVAKDIVPEIDAGPLYGEEEIEKINSLRGEMEKNPKLDVSQNPNFNHYYFKNKKDYDFFIYSPKKIVFKQTIDSIFDNSLDPELREVVFMPNNSKYKNTSLQQGVSVSYKVSPNDPTRYYIKLANLETDKPFAIHLTQAFKSSWKIVWISREEYEKIDCISKPVSFQKSNNSSCQYDSPMIDLETALYLNSSSASSNYHIEGNYIGNTWIIYPKDIPELTVQNNELYGVIIYKNQVYYLITILIASTALLLLTIYTLIQEVRKFYDKN